MTHIAYAAFYAWMAFIVSWWLSALWVNRATKRGAAGKSIAYYAGFTIGFACLFAFIGRAAWSVPPAAQAILLAVELAGFAFAWWARLHLGRLWSGMLTLREGHKVVESGPYGLVRHPIYTGFISASLAFALLSGQPVRLLGALILTAVMAIKSGEEENWLRKELGAADYDDYAGRVPMLIPFMRP